MAGDRRCSGLLASSVDPDAAAGKKLVWWAAAFGAGAYAGYQIAFYPADTSGWGVVGVLLSAAFYVGWTGGLLAISGVVAALLYRALSKRRLPRAGTVLVVAASYGAGVGVGFVMTPVLGLEYRYAEPTILEPGATMALGLAGVAGYARARRQPRPGLGARALTMAAALLATIGCTPQAVGAWTATGSLVEAGEHRTATLLQDGRVLAVGGWNGAIFLADAGTGYLASAELYDPNSGSWTAAAPMGEPRVGHTATSLPDGSVLVVGGGGVDGALSSAELFDPAAGTWTVISSTTATRDGHTATLLATGLVLVVGGSGADGGDALQSAELYDPASGTWSAAGSLAEGRVVHTATLLGDGKVLVAGGASGSSRLASAEIYDPALGTWTQTGAMPGVRNEHTATLLADGRVLVAGGLQPAPVSNSVIFDPATGTWSDGPSMAAVRHQHAAARMADGSVLIAGGLGAGGTLASAERYVASTNSWTPTGPMVDALAHRSAVLMPDGRVLIIGGVTTIEPVRVSELFSLDGP